MDTLLVENLEYISSEMLDVVIEQCPGVTFTVHNYSHGMILVFTLAQNVYEKCFGIMMRLFMLNLMYLVLYKNIRCSQECNSVHQLILNQYL
jgi:hypothetical protein